MDPDVPGGEIGGEEQARERNDDPERSARPVHRLPGQSSEQNRNGRASESRQKPAATGPTPANRTSQGPSASALLPIRSAGKANG